MIYMKSSTCTLSRFLAFVLPLLLLTHSLRLSSVSITKLITFFALISVYPLVSLRVFPSLSAHSRDLFPIEILLTSVMHASVVLTYLLVSCSWKYDHAK